MFCEGNQKVKKTKPRSHHGHGTLVWGARSDLGEMYGLRFHRDSATFSPAKVKESLETRFLPNWRSGCSHDLEREPTLSAKRFPFRFFGSQGNHPLTKRNMAGYPGLLKRYILPPFEAWFPFPTPKQRRTPPFTSCNVQVFFCIRIPVTYSCTWDPRVCRLQFLLGGEGCSALA